MLVNKKIDGVIRVSGMIILLALQTLITSAQDTTLVTGRVFSDRSKPLSNVSVSVAGSFALPVVTDGGGRFTVVSESPEDWLIISPATGYKTKRVFLNNRKKLEIYLTPTDVASGDDQLLVLSRPIARRNLAAAYSSVNMSGLRASAAVTIDQFIQGRASGVNSVIRSGHPGSGAYISLRGINSLNTSNQPLYLIDGIPVTPTGIFGSNIRGYAFNPLVELNPFDVSSITIIKDPAITASYGSRGSNGVIMFETLDPSVTQTVIELDLRTGISLTQDNTIPQLNAEQHKTLIHEVLYSSGKFEEDLAFEYPNLFLEPDDERYIDYQHNTNWQERIFDNAISSGLNINVKGGDEIATYGLSFGLVDNQGIIRNTGYKGYNLRFVSRLNVFRWLKMNAGVSLNYNKGTLKEAATSKETSPILAALGKSPMLNPFQYDEQQKEISKVTEVDELGVSNPVAIIRAFEGNNTNSSFVYSMGLHATVNSYVSLRSKFNFTYNTLKEQVFMPNHGMEHYYNDEAINVSKASNNNITSFYNNTYLNINRQLNEKHNISSMTGFNIQTNKFEFDWGLTKNAHESDQYKVLSEGQPNLREIGGQNRTWNWLSIYENLFYTYKDKYIITASIALDGSSRIGNQAENTLKLGKVPFGLFYSAGFAWRLSNESFLKNRGWLEDLKWRISYGKSGNDDIGESSASNYYSAIKFRETVGLYPAIITNEKLTYENVSQLNTGIDLSLWGNRFTVTLDVFRSQTKNMLIFNPVKTYIGYDYQMENTGKMKNSGFEINTFGRIIDKNDFRWDLNINLTKVVNEVVDIKGSKIVTEIPGGEIVNVSGSPANSFYGYIYKGVFASTADAETAGLINEKSLPFEAGDAIFADLSGPEGTPDGVINDYDKTVIGSSLPAFTGGIENTIGWRRFTLRALIQFVQGNEAYNYVRYLNERMSGLENQSASVLTRWHHEDQQTNVPRSLWEDPLGNSSFSTRWIEDASFIRLRNVSLSYTIPNEFLKFKYAEFYISVNNVLTLTKYLGYDPEFSYSFMAIHQGIDYGLTPQSRQFIVGIKVGL